MLAGFHRIARAALRPSVDSILADESLGLLVSYHQPKQGIADLQEAKNS